MVPGKSPNYLFTIDELTFNSQSVTWLVVVVV